MNMCIKKITLTLMICLLNINIINANTHVEQEVKSGYNLKIPDFEKITEIIQELKTKGEIPGINVSIISKNEVIYRKSFGFSDMSSRQSVNDSTLFQIASNTKAFTALAIQRLIRNNRIKSDENIAKYLPWFKPKYKGKDAIVTISQCLNQTSGIPFPTIGKIGTSESKDALLNSMRKLENVKLISEPGKKFNYASANYDLLGLLIQVISKISYEDYMQDSLFPLLDMKYSYSNLNIASEKKNMSQGHKINFRLSKQYKAPWYRGNTPAAYLVSNTLDMSKWIIANIAEHDSGIYQDIKMTHIADNSIPLFMGKFKYGQGWYLDETGKYKKIFHSGSNPNFSSYVGIIPEMKLGVVILSNSNSRITDQIGEKIINEFVPNSISYLPMDGNKISSIIFFVILILSIIVELLLIFKIYNLIKKKMVMQNPKKQKSVLTVLKFTFQVLLPNFFSFLIIVFPLLALGNNAFGFLEVWTPRVVVPSLMSVCIVTVTIDFHIILKHLKRG